MRFVPNPPAVPWFATMYGVGDPHAWSALPKALGLGGVRITDIIQRDLTDLADDPEGKLAETDAKLEHYANAGLFAIIDLSYLRNLLIQAGINPYRLTTTTYRIIHDAVIALATRRNHRTGIVYGEDPVIAYVALAGEPEAYRWGEDHRRARSFDELLEWYQRVAAIWHEHSDIPTSTGGIMHFGTKDSNLDFAQLAALPGNQVPAVHCYHDADLAALPEAVAAAHRLGKPMVLEELGLDLAAYPDDQARAAAYRQRIDAALRAGVDGIGLWNLGLGVGHDLNPGRDVTSAATLRAAIALTQR